MKRVSLVSVCFLAIALLLTACGSGGGGGPAGTAGTASIITSQAVLPVGDANCPDGGVQFDYGIDTNSNGLFDASEVNGSEYICNGAAGAAGTDGQTALINTTALPVGDATCSDGGQKVDSGLDANSDSVLQAGEVSSTSYVCNGADGGTGSAGSAGTDGQTALINTTALPVGDATCSDGGQQVDSGLDANSDSILQAGEVSSTIYLCNGADGANWWDDLGATTGAIEGSVRLESGVNAEGAMVSISGTAHYAFVDHFGSYSFSHVAVGHQDLLIEYYGHSPERLERVPVTGNNTTTVRDVLLSLIRKPLDDTSSLGEFVAFEGKAASDLSGWSVSSAGDVNGDGYDDILIGAYGASLNAGETYLIYGEPGMDMTAALSLEPDVTFTGAASDYSGLSVSTAGDVNGDGYDDILIGAYGASSYAGKTYLIYGSSTLSGTKALSTADVTFTGVLDGDNSGYSVSTAGDVNGDGYDDILIGAFGADPASGTNAGETYLIYGSSSLIGTVDLLDANVTFTGKAIDDQSGYSVSSAGDVNGDGYDDILIGANGADPGGNLSAGETYLIYGSSTLSGTVDLLTADVTFTGNAAFDYSGSSVATAGDVNGDGYDDILIGAAGADPAAGTDAGETYLIYGSSTLSGPKALDANADVTFTGKAIGDKSGFSVSTAGDVNGDGYDDVLIGANGASSLAGETYLIYGSSTLGSAVDLLTADATFTGKAAGDKSGFSVSTAGDVNNDGYDDVLIGAYRADPASGTDAGETYLIMGRERSVSTASNMLTGTRANGTADTTFTGNVAGDNSGVSVSTAGDVNGDGYDDILIGAYGADPGSNSFAGETYLIYGEPGMDMTAALSFEPDVTFTGKAANDWSGISVSTAGDVNGDGYDDILIGAYRADPASGANAGETYLIYGSSSLGSAVALSGADVTFTGKAASDQSGYSVSTAGDVNGDGYDDILIGANWANPGDVSNAGETYLIYGSSTLGSAVDLLNADVTFTGNAAFDNSGISVSTAGDVNGDGYDDILISARYADPAAGGTDAGETYLIYGSSTLSGTKALATNADVTFTGKAAGDWSGVSVSTAGDVNGDGYDDILIGASEVSLSAGETYLIYGSSTLSGTKALSTADVTFTGKAASDQSGYSVSTAGDVNGDGYDDVLIGAYGASLSAGETYLIYGSSTLIDMALSGANVTFTGKAAGDWSGYSVSTAGDVNGDGYDDVLIGANLADPASGTDAGETYLFFGM